MPYNKIPYRKFSFPCYFYTIFDQKIRIRKTRKGFIAEKFIKGFWKNKWIPLITYNGSYDAFPYQSEFECRKAILRKVSEQLKTPIP